MKKIILLLAFMSLSLFADLQNKFITQKMLDSSLPIVDIRTVGEWRETGLLKKVIPIVFFNARGAYDVAAFLKELNAKVDTKKPFALICHTGSRTAMVSQFLAKELHYDVINLKGGMDYATKVLHLKTYPYSKK